MPGYLSNRGYVNYDANTGAYSGGKFNVYDYDQTLGIKQLKILTPTNTTGGGKLDKRSQYLYVLKSQYTSNFNFAALIVAGGGGAGSDVGGGGGGGGVICQTIVSVPKTSYTIVVGCGGLAGNSTVTHGQNGGNSVAFGLTAVGGGGGGLYAGVAGYSGGSGGGGGGVSGAGGCGTAGQGFKGGNASGCYWGSGAGGGAGAVGGNASGTNGGNGGNGLPSTITGTLTYYGGGGGGGGGCNGGVSGSAGSGGLGGGGAGQRRTSGLNGANGAPNTGGGAGGTAAPSRNPAAYGGSGIVIVSYVGAQTASGGIVTSVSNSSGIFTVHSFLSNGTFSIPT
jgi:hypothetical protein